METNSNFWKRCSSCKKEIPFNAPYQVCSVSTCQSKRKGLVFCSVTCWDAHLGFANHREASAEENRAPSSSVSQQPVRKKIVTPPPSQHESAKKKPSLANVDTLVVVSKIKNFIRDHSEYNTSQCAIDALTQRVVDECLKGIEQATAAGRKTVMGRDINVKGGKF